MNKRPVCNYEGSRYSTEFWNEARAYEDAAERVALKAMMPRQGQTLMEIGAGYGRLADLYADYETVVLLDFAHTQLAQAVERLGSTGPNGKPKYVYVQANFYHLPFVSGRFDTVSMIRTLHHAVEAPTVIRNVSDVLAPSGVFMLEFANKHNLKAIARYLLKRQTWSPFTLDPVEFVELNFDFHPRWIWAQLAACGLEREAIRTVSHYRMGLLKRWVSTRLLVALDALVQPTGRLWQLSPSVFVRSRADSAHTAAAPESFFRCPACGRALGAPPQGVFQCTCGETWQRNGEIYDFRYPRE